MQHNRNYKALAPDLRAPLKEKKRHRGFSQVLHTMDKTFARWQCWQFSWAVIQMQQGTRLTKVCFCFFSKNFKTKKEKWKKHHHIPNYRNGTGKQLFIFLKCFDPHNFQFMTCSTSMKAKPCDSAHYTPLQPPVHLIYWDTICSFFRWKWSSEQKGWSC